MIYNALVADDESIIRRGIIRFLNKYDNINVVAEAEDGEMALEVAHREQLDLLLVDINMPIMNGLQFVEQLRKIQPNAAVIIVTGYDSFEYARQALQLGVREYVLKPIMEDAFDAVISKILKGLDKQYQEQRYLQWAKSTLAVNRTFLIDDFLGKWLAGSLKEQEIRDKTTYLSINISTPFCITLISIEECQRLDGNNHWNDELIILAVENIVNEIYSRTGETVICRQFSNRLVVISDTLSSEAMAVRNEQCADAVAQYLPAKITLLTRTGLLQSEIPDIYSSMSEELSTFRGNTSTIRDVKMYIEQNFYNEEVSLLSAADYSCLSPQHLSRAFKKETGITFVDYLTKVRIRKAKDLFARDELKMYEIAEMVGYSNQHYFSTVFRRATGMSPGEYRKQYREQETRVL